MKLERSEVRKEWSSRVDVDYLLPEVWMGTKGFCWVGTEDTASSRSNHSLVQGGFLLKDFDVSTLQGNLRLDL